MSSFKIVNGNINAINEEELGNHTWVEKEEWVYDVTDGMKWRKDAYYSIYQPNIVSVYDNNECLNWNFYQEEVNGSNTEHFSYDQALMLEMIELLETENPSYTHDKLMKEREIFRKENLISKNPTLLELANYVKDNKNQEKIGNLDWKEIINKDTLLEKKLI